MGRRWSNGLDWHVRFRRRAGFGENNFARRGQVLGGDIGRGDLVVGHRGFGEALAIGGGRSRVAYRRRLGRGGRGGRDGNMAAPRTLRLATEMSRVQFEKRAASGALAGNVHSTKSRVASFTPSRRPLSNPKRPASEPPVRGKFAPTVQESGPIPSLYRSLELRYRRFERLSVLNLRSHWVDPFSFECAERMPVLNPDRRLQSIYRFSKNKTSPAHA